MTQWLVMTHGCIFGGLILLCVGCSQVSDGVHDFDDRPLPAQVDFNFHIRPLLSDRCFACHGPDEQAREADLSLYTQEGAFGPLDSSHQTFPFVPGRPDKSAAYERITSNDPEYMMPPPESNLSLNTYEKSLIRKWIKQGAKWKDHWAYLQPEKPPLPKVRKKDWAVNAIDYFILDKLEVSGLKPEEQATRQQLIRRVSFDLTGLPPTLEQIDQFTSDDSPEAYDQLVERLLDSPAYGERMAFDWLDVSRYADSHGYQDDRPRTMWPWRDWVISAFNDNLSYEQFVTWQLAGDLLPDATYEQKLATGFNRNHAITQEGGVINEEYLNEYAADRVQTFATAFIGQTMQCARCHDHKYDPITQEDFYSVLAFFNNVKNERGQISYFDLAPEPSMPAENKLQDSVVEEIKEMIVRVQQQDVSWREKAKTSFSRWSADPLNLTGMDDQLEKGQLAYLPLDGESKAGWENYGTSGTKGRVNINLPPDIEQPAVVKGISGNALRFNGSNFLSVGEVGDFDDYDTFSFGGWIRHSSTHKRDAGLFSRRNGEQKRQGYQLVLTRSNQLKASLIADDRHSIHVQARRALSPGIWTHVFLTYDGSGIAEGIRIYVNGETTPLQVLRDSLGGESMLNGNDFLVGNWNHRARALKDLYGFEGGQIDEVRLYDRLLSPLEIRILANPDEDLAAFNEDDLFTHFLLRADTGYRGIQDNLRFWRRQDQHIPSVMIMDEADTIKSTYLLARGAYDARVRQVKRGTPTAILDFSPDLPQDRLGLARWLFSEDNPLTARVYVNRIWQMCFGRGLVATPDDYGSQGALPTHPELLDWLAAGFEESDWNIKALLKLIVSSSTYRQSAAMSLKKMQRDPENVLLSRGPSVRLSAEMIRDQVLMTSGLLNRTIGGKWVKPYQPSGIWKEMANQIGENKYRMGLGEELYRRSLYTYWKRTIPPPTMLALDAPERAVCTVKRQATSTPLQSLILLNDPQYVEAARVMAERLMVLYEEDRFRWISESFRKLLSRYPTSAETQVLQDLYDTELQRFDSNDSDALRLLAIGARPRDTALDPIEVAVLTVVINTIVNLDEAKFK